jgi:hypothetical protein
LKELLLLLFLKVVLEWTYVGFVYPLYEYMGFSLDLNLIKLVESYIFVIHLYFFLPQDERKISTVGVQLLFLLMIVPMLSLYGLINGPRLYVYFCASSFFLVVLCVTSFPIIKIRKISNLNGVLFVFLGTFSIFVYVMLVKLNGIPTIKALNFSNAYKIRSTVNFGPNIMGYLVKWQGNVINCFLIGLAYYKRNYLLLVLIFSLQVLLFLICAQKSFLLSPFALLFLLYAIERRRVMMLSLVSLNVVVLLSFGLYEMEISKIPASMLIRRLFFVPAEISFSYYDFFSKNEYMYLSHSKMGFGLAKNPYDSYGMSYAHMMGMIYRNKPGMSMNTGYMGEAYMNFGTGGMFVFSIMLGLMLVVADSVCKKTSITLAVAAAGIPILQLVNGALFSTMLTGGFLLGLLVVWLYNEKSSEGSGTRGSVRVSGKSGKLVL